MSSPAEHRGIALVTGASRGIGKAIAVHLAKAGYDVVITARTLAEGEQREHSSTVKKSDTRPLPGSLASTAELIAAEGRAAHTIPADLLDRASIAAAAAEVIERFGGIDVLVNNGRYIGPGHMDRFLETPLDLLDAHLEANVMAPLTLLQALLPSMVARGHGLAVTITSDVAWTDPPAPAGGGGWGLGYGMSKGALHRVAGVLAQELAGTGVSCVNVQPGFVATERIAMDMKQFGFDADRGVPAAAIGAAVAALASDPELAATWNGKIFNAPAFTREHGLLPGWPA